MKIWPPSGHDFSTDQEFLFNHPRTICESDHAVVSDKNILRENPASSVVAIVFDESQ